jgi:dTDP-4-amino-4,6-dideoxygalactose transaminase
MRESFLPFSPPLIGDEEIAEVVDTLRSGWLTAGPKTQRFEASFAELVGAPAALAVNSCTAALHLALLASGVGEGDEVITTPMTFAASVNVIEHVGARPVLVDVEPDTLNIDAAGVAAAVTGRTRAVLPVHYAGHPVDLDAIRAVAEEHSLAVVEDAAHALCAAYGGKPIGAGGNVAAFSFYATKNLTTGEGGMLTGPPELLGQARVLSLHGMNRDAWRRYDESGTWFYAIESPGFKYNMSEIQASLGLQQLQKLEGFQQRRRAVVQRYDEAFAQLDALQTPATRPGVTHAHHLYVLRLRPGRLAIDRNTFIDELRARRIGTSVHFIPVHLHPYYRDKYGWQPDDFPIAYENYQRMLSLPLNPALTEQDVEDVIGAVRDVVLGGGK